MVLIDLGEIPAAVPADRPPTLDATSRPRHSYRGRRLAVIALATAFAVSASGVAVGRTLPVVRIPVGANARLMVVGATAVVSDQRAGTNEIAAYDLTSGRPLWQSPLGGTARNAQMFAVSSTAVVETAHDVGYDLVEGFSLATGVRRWTMPALMVTPIPIGLLVYRAAGAAGPDPNAIDVSLIDPVTGDTRWRTAIGTGCDVGLATDASLTMASGLVEVCPDTQEIVAIDLTTGAVRARIHPDVLGPAGTHHGYRTDLDHGTPGLSIAYVGDVAILAVPRRYPSRSLSAFRTSDLQPLWQGLQVASGDALTTCGTDICIAAGSGGAIAIDPATGHTVTAPPAAVGDLAAAGSRPLPGVTTTLVIVAPGQETVATPAIASVDYRIPEAAGQSEAVRPLATGDTWIALNGEEAIRPVQLLHGVADSSCTVITSYVACTTGVNTVTVWTLRTG